MQIEERATEDVTILDLKGKMTLGEIVRTYTTTSRQGGSLKLLALPSAPSTSSPLRSS